MESELKVMLASLERTGCCQWIKSEGVPIVEGFAVDDVREQKLEPERRPETRAPSERGNDLQPGRPRCYGNLAGQRKKAAVRMGTVQSFCFAALRRI